MGLTQEAFPLVNRPWYEARTTHFYTYSCGPTQEVAKLAARLEQFRGAYGALAGPQAVASPPIVVLAFPDKAALQDFVPLYQGKPTSLAGFFHRGSDENLIVLSLTDSGPGTLEIILHEYAHLLLRRNGQIWPVWLNEGMADIYSKFEVVGERTVRIGGIKESYLRLLKQEPFRPFKDLFAVTQESPEYNEREHQGMLYAQSWLLTHYLMIGNPVHRARFGELTTLLRQGQSPEQAFTNTFKTSLPAMEKELQAYLQRGKFDTFSFSVQANLLAPQPLQWRRLTPAETCFRLGDELLRIGRLDTAEAYFLQSRKLSPESPLGWEGLGLLAVERRQHSESFTFFDEALRRGSTSFLAHYFWAKQKLRLSGNAEGNIMRLGEPVASEIRARLEKALQLMPDFGPAHHVLGFFELVQGAHPSSAEQHLRRAIELEPENQVYLLTLAQAQIAGQDTKAARRTLESLLLPYVSVQVRVHAELLLKNLDGKK